MANVTASVSLTSVTATAGDQVNVTVEPTITTVEVSSSLVSNIDIRAALSNVSPILYDNSTGVFSFDSAASFAGKTTDDLAEGTTNLYLNGAGTTSDLTEGTNLYYTESRANSAIDDRIPDYIATNTIFLKDYRETVVDSGNVSGNVGLNLGAGTIHKVRAVADITGLTLQSQDDGSTVQIIIEQDAVGGHALDTASGWDSYRFANDYTTLAQAGAENSVLTITHYDGINYASLVTLDAPTALDNSALANSNVIVNGTTINLGGSGNISHFGSLTTDNLTEGSTNLYYSDSLVNTFLTVTGVTGNMIVNGNLDVAGNINYQNVVDLYVQDQKITLNANAATDATVEIIANRPVAGANTALRWNETSDIWEFTNDGSTYYPIPTSTTDLAEGTNQYFTTARANSAMDAYLTSITANVDSVNGATGVVVLDTDDISEGTTNKYFSNTLARAAVSASGDLSYDQANGIFSVTTYKSADFDTDFAAKTTDDLTEGSTNLYFTNTNANTWFTTQTTDNLTEGASNLYFTTDRANTNSDAWITTKSTSDLAEGTNLYYTTDRANAAIGAYQGDINTAGDITGDIITATDEFVGDLDGAVRKRVEAAENLSKGDIVYISGGSGDVPHVQKALASDASKMPAVGFVIDGNINSGSEGQIATFGLFSGINTSAYTVGTILYVDPTTAGAFTDTKPTGEANLIQKMGKVIKSGAGSSGKIFVVGAGRANATPNLDEGNIFLGSSSDTAITVTPSNNFATTGNAFELSNTLSNVNTITTEDATGFTVNSKDGIVFKQEFAVSNSEVASISGDGYAVRIQGTSAGNYLGDLLSYSGSDPVVAYNVSGNIVNGSNEVTITAITRMQDDAAATVSDLSAGMAYSAGTGKDSIGTAPTGFPIYTYVTSVDSANSKVIMSENAQANIDFADHTLFHALVDTTRNQTIKIRSEFDDNGGSNTTINLNDPQNNDAYGYPESGFAAGQFDVFSAGSSGDYTFDANVANFFVHRTSFMQGGAEPKFTGGLVVGENTSLTSRGFNDQVQGFGINMLWDGVSTAGDSSKIPQILARSYRDNTLASVLKAAAGPRLFFASNSGNADDYPFSTYPEANQELGRITWWGTTGDNTSPGTTNPPAMISVQSANDWETQGVVAGNTNVFMSATAAKDEGSDLYLSYKEGALILASKGSGDQPIIFAPTQFSSNAPHNAYSGNYAQWATVNYADTVASSGSKFTVTNGGSSDAGTVGDLELALFRNDVTDGGSNVTATSNYVIGANFYNTFYGQGYAAVLMGQYNNQVDLTGLNDGDAFTPSGWSGALGTEINGNTYYAKVTTLPTGSPFFGQYSVGFYDDAALTTPTTLTTTNGNYGGSGTIEWTQAPAVTDREYKFRLQEQSDTLEFVTIDSASSETTLMTYTDSAISTNVTLNAGTVNATTVDADTVNLKQFNETTVALGSVSGDQSSAIDAASGSIYTLTATGGITIDSIANAVAGTSMTIIITQDGTGSHTLSSAMLFAGGSKTLSTGAGDVDIISVLYDGTNYFASLTRNYS